MDEVAATFFRALILSAFLLLPVIFFCKTVGSIVRWFNLRDDPRHAKRPPYDP